LGVCSTHLGRCTTHGTGRHTLYLEREEGCSTVLASQYLKKKSMREASFCVYIDLHCFL
jgi:hypothetical protein